MLKSLGWLVFILLLASRAAAYGPLSLPEDEARPPLDLDIGDAARERTIPVRIFLPLSAENAAHPIVPLGIARPMTLPQASSD